MRVLWFNAVAAMLLVLGAASAEKALGTTSKRDGHARNEPATTIPTPRNESWWYEQSSGYSAIAARSERIDIVFLGDSITQGWRDVGHPVWQDYYARRHAVNFGIGGDRTEHSLWRVLNGNFAGVIERDNPKVVVLMIGTNNTGSHAPPAIAQGVKANIDAILAKAPRSRILLLAIFPRGQSPLSRERLAVHQTNQILANLADGQAVSYLDIGPDLLEQDGTLSPQIMPDFLHLSERGYQIWASRMEPVLTQLLQL
jgi:beta-glucosidase